MIQNPAGTEHAVREVRTESKRRVPYARLRTAVTYGCLPLALGVLVFVPEAGVRFIGGVGLVVFAAICIRASMIGAAFSPTHVEVTNMFRRVRVDYSEIENVYIRWISYVSIQTKRGTRIAVDAATFDRRLGIQGLRAFIDYFASKVGPESSNWGDPS